MKIFDAHFHIINFDFPIFENQGFTPEEYNVADYKSATSLYELVGGAVVSGSFQKYDQDYLIDALPKLGKSYVGVANIPIDLKHSELEYLNDHNIVAVRFNLKRGGSEVLKNLEYLSNKLYEEFGWHTELYVDSSKLEDLDGVLRKLKKFSIDHIGLSKGGLKSLYAWADKGVKIKATGFGRVDFDPIPVLQDIHHINPSALMFGTDLPSTRATVPFSHSDVELIADNFDEASQEKIFYKNALSWYMKK